MEPNRNLDSVMETRDHFKNGSSLENVNRISIKCIALFLTILILMQSCFTTRYVSNEQTLKRDFRGASVDDIEFELGEPDEKEVLRNGYVYTYYYGMGRNGEMFERYMFDNNDKLRQIQSTNTVPKKYFSPFKTFGIPFIILGGIVITAVIVVGVASDFR